MLLPAGVAVGGGILWGLCHGQDPWWPASWLSLVPLVSLLGLPGCRQTFFCGWLHGTVTWLVGIPWIAFTLESYGGLPAPLAALLLLALALYLGGFHGAFALLGRPLWRRGGGWALLGLPALWVGVEHLQGWLFGGFPWNLAAYAWTEVPGALPLAAWGGAFGISFLLLLVNTALARSLQERRVGPALLGVMPVAVVLVLAAAGPAGEEGMPRAAGEAAGSGLAVRIVQPNIAMASALEWQQVEAGYQRLLALSRQACDRPGALLLWPESAGWPLVLEDDRYFPGRLRRDLEELAARGCPVLFNSVHHEPEGFFNSAFLLAADGSLQRYDKRHLVPWGEYVPLADLLPFVGKLARNAGDFQAAREVRILTQGGERLGLGLCYESVFPLEVAESVRQGASVLVTLSNDAWYGDSAARRQLFRTVRFRAAENRRPMLRAAITGISAVVGPRGEVRQSLGLDEAGILRAEVRGRAERTPFTRWPGLVPGASLIGAAFAIIAARRRRP